MPNAPASTTSRSKRPASQSGEANIRPVDDLVDYLKEYAREKPEMAALWCFGVGFVLGWRLKPW